MAARIQGAYRCFQARSMMWMILNFRARTKVAISLQACYRGRAGRRIGFGKRRIRAISNDVLLARRGESRLLRACFITRRREHAPLRISQNRVRAFLRFLSISPATYTRWENLKIELRQDYLDTRNELEVKWEVFRTQGVCHHFACIVSVTNFTS